MIKSKSETENCNPCKIAKQVNKISTGRVKKKMLPKRTMCLAVRLGDLVARP